MRLNRLNHGFHAFFILNSEFFILHSPRHYDSWSFTMLGFQDGIETVSHSAVPRRANPTAAWPPHSR
jgi:hypothetical protein